MSNKKQKIIVHTCCASCASYVFSELEKSNYEIIAYFYNPEVHGKAEYERRLKNVRQLCKKMDITLMVPKYNIQEYFVPLMPFQDKNSIKYITDKKRYRRKRCQLCISILLRQTVNEAIKQKIKKVTTTMLCSPYKNHNEIWDLGEKYASQDKLHFYYKDFRKGYWEGRNFSRANKYDIPTYCGCSESLEEGILE